MTLMVLLYIMLYYLDNDLVVLRGGVQDIVQSLLSNKPLINRVAIIQLITKLVSTGQQCALLLSCHRAQDAGGYEE